MPFAAGSAIRWWTPDVRVTSPQSTGCRSSPVPDAAGEESTVSEVDDVGDAVVVVVVVVVVVSEVESEAVVFPVPKDVWARGRLIVLSDSC
jgi:hypothetical protein